MISLEEAQRKVISQIHPLQSFERVSLKEAVGRVLSETIYAALDQPPFTNSAMDGFAMRAEDVRDASPECPVTLRVKAFQPAGALPEALPEASPEAVEIATGAPLPLGADAVVMKEHARLRDSEIILERPLSVGENIRQAGETLVKGTPIFMAGEKIFANNMGLLASCGLDSLSVVRRPRIVYLATGDEIVGIGQPRGDHQIYNSNMPVLRALFEKEGCTFWDLGISKDSEDELSSKLHKAYDLEPDILVLTGGVSVGRRDLVKELLEKSGAETLFHKVAMKPGKPILFAKRHETFIFGLPGNPVSAQVGFYQFVYPAIQKLLNAKNLFLEEEKALLEREIASQKRHLILIGLKRKKNGMTTVMPLKEGSGSVSSFSLGNCFISIPTGDQPWGRNTMVGIQSYV